MPINSLILPFAVRAEKAGKAFTSSMEVATILLMTEANRKKRSLLSSGAKSTLFVSKLHYPLWLVPVGNGTLVADGRGVFSSSIKYPLLPDVTVFIDDVDRGASTRKEFQTALEKHAHTFDDYAKIDQIQLKALISDRELLSALSEQVETAAAQESEKQEAIVLAPPKLDQETAVAIGKEVVSLKKKIVSDIQSLEFTLKLLDDTAKLHEQMSAREVEFTKEVYEDQISRVRPSVEKKVDRLFKEMDARIAKINRVTEHELKDKGQELEKREGELQRLELNRHAYARKREARKDKHDKLGATHWEHAIRVDEKRIEETKARIHALSEFIDKIKKQSEADTEKIKYGYGDLIERERRKIREIENQRDRSIESKQAEIGKLRLAANEITGQIQRLLERKRESMVELEESNIHRLFESITLLCVPFYLVGYQIEQKKQFQVFSPIKVMSSQGIVRTLEKTISSLRSSSALQVFLQPRSKSLSRMLDSLTQDMKSDNAFSEKMRQAAVSCNVLEKDNFAQMLNQGAGELLTEGLISQKDRDDIFRAYSVRKA